MKAHQAEYPIATQCRVLGVSTSGYYAWLKRAPSARSKANAELLEEIKKSHKKSDGTYGAPRIHADLPKEMGASLNRVARVMCDVGIQGVTRRKWTKTTVRDEDERAAPDLVDRDFTATGPDQLWVADITYIPTWAGFLYLAVVMDVWSRRIVGWAMATHLRTELVLDALNMALRQRRPEVVVHHSDQGSQGEFKRSSQHLRKEEELRWRQASADGRIELCVRRWVHPVVPRWGAGSIGRGFGKKLLEGCRARSRRWQPACLPLLERAGFANVVACHLSVFVLCRGATYRSSSEKRLRFFKPAVVAYVRSPGSCAAHRRRSRENCGGTQQREVETSSIEPRPPNGMPIGERSVRKLPNSLRTAN